MQIKGISDGDIVGVRMFNEGYNMPTSFKKGRMLLIFLDDEHFKGYKIREQGEITNDRTGYNTYHYKGGVKNKSSKPHSIDSIKGIVSGGKSSFSSAVSKAKEKKNNTFNKYCINTY